MARKVKCIITWRISARCRICLSLIRSTPAAPGAHLDPEAGMLPTCSVCCLTCKLWLFCRSREVSLLLSTRAALRWLALRNLGVPCQRVFRAS